MLKKIIANFIALSIVMTSSAIAATTSAKETQRYFSVNENGETYELSKEEADTIVAEIARNCYFEQYGEEMPEC